MRRPRPLRVGVDAVTTVLEAAGLLSLNAAAGVVGGLPALLLAAGCSAFAVSWSLNGRPMPAPARARRPAPREDAS